MFKKSKLTFKNSAVFEKRFKPFIDTVFCVVSKMMFFDRINVDGTVNPEQAGYLNKYELWSYIYYLFYYNNSTVGEFMEMKDTKTGKANAFKMYTVVKEVVDNQFVDGEDIVPFDVNTLIYFINIVTQKYGPDLRNPIVDYLQKILASKEAMTSINKFSIVTGQKDGNIVVVSNPSNIENANIKIGFRGGVRKTTR